MCVSSLRRGHANLLCIVPILTDDPRRESDSTCAPRALDSGFTRSRRTLGAQRLWYRNSGATENPKLATNAFCARFRHPRRQLQATCKVPCREHKTCRVPSRYLKSRKSPQPTSLIQLAKREAFASAERPPQAKKCKKYQKFIGMFCLGVGPRTS